MAHVVEVDLVVTKMHSFGYIGFRCCWQVLVDRRIWAKRKGCEAFASQPFLSHMDIVIVAMSISSLGAIYILLSLLGVIPV